VALPEILHSGKAVVSRPLKYPDFAGKLGCGVDFLAN
jgi:hypothetical protein